MYECMYIYEQCSNYNSFVMCVSVLIKTSVPCRVEELRLIPDRNDNHKENK